MEDVIPLLLLYVVVGGLASIGTRMWQYRAQQCLRTVCIDMVYRGSAVTAIFWIDISRDKMRSIPTAMLADPYLDQLLEIASVAGLMEDIYWEHDGVIVRKFALRYR